MNPDIERLAREAGMVPREHAHAAGLWQGYNDALEAFARAVAAECARIVEPVGQRPCDCDICDCGNSGDARAVSYWDAEETLAAAIRAKFGVKP